MKKLFYSLIIIVAFSYNNSRVVEKMEMPGAYKLLSQVLKIGPKDTSVGEIRQLKIFTPEFMMYGNVNISTPDSVSSFGIGGYSIDADKVTEHVIYSASGSDISTEPANFSLDITKTPRGFKQFIPNLGPSAGRPVTLTEEYENVGSATASPLDGSWKQVKAYSVKGNDTSINSGIQFKTYYGGHFIWGHTFKDSANKNHTGTGFGTFKPDGANKIKETVIISTYSPIIGQTLDIDIKMNGNDEYQQTSYFTRGQTSVEIYQRLKK